RSFAERDGENSTGRTHASQRVMAIDDLAGVEIEAAPERQRFGGDERLAPRVARHNRATGDHAFLHGASSRTTRPSTADATQSARLPNVTRVLSRLGA